MLASAVYLPRGSAIIKMLEYAPWAALLLHPPMLLKVDWGWDGLGLAG